jgi:thioredoxin reductase
MTTTTTTTTTTTSHATATALHNKNLSLAPVTVAVIGGGPSGMFFCHAWESLMREGRADPTRPPLAITCFERATAPGGVWNIPKGEGMKNSSSCSESSNGSSTSTSGVLVGMYSGLWTNGPSHTIEFPDYTYLDHFGPDYPVTVYMRRSELLSYMMGRVTKHCPDFVDKYMELETQVERVHYNDTTHKFEVTTTTTNRNPKSPPLQSQQQSHQQPPITTTNTTREFDKCVWACGENGRPNVPFAVQNMFHTGGFRGAVLHACETAQLDFHVRHKRVLMVGGSYSAEDLALQAIKLGVAQIYISCRDRDAPVTWTGAWPMDKVQILLGQAPFQITENGTCIELRTTTWMWPAGYKFKEEEEEEDDKNTTKLYDIDTVIFCTGYHTNMDMLEENLRIDYKNCEASGKNVMTVPTDWKMKTPNTLSVLPGLDDIVPSVSSSSSSKLSSSPNANHPPGQVLYDIDFETPDLFCGFLISNPNMMYIAEFYSDYPLTACDVSAWLVVSYLCGHNVLPDATTMHKINQEESLRDLSVPYQRYCRDKAYHDAVHKAAAVAAPEVLLFQQEDKVSNEDVDEKDEHDDDDDDDDTSNASEEEQSSHVTFSDSDLLETIQAEHDTYQFQLLASTMEEAGYPLNIGTIDGLNEKGRAWQTFGDLWMAHKSHRTKKELKRDPLKTFRDCDDSEQFYSLFTGTPAVPLKEKWLSMMEEEEEGSSQPQA